MQDSPVYVNPGSALLRSDYLASSYILFVISAGGEGEITYLSEPSTLFDNINSLIYTEGLGSTPDSKHLHLILFIFGWVHRWCFVAV